MFENFLRMVLGWFGISIPQEPMPLPAPSINFGGLAGGVYIRQPNGGSDLVQNLIEQELRKGGMRLYSISRSAGERLVQERTWNQTLTEQCLDATLPRLVVAGTIIVKTTNISVPSGQKLVRGINPVNGKRWSWYDSAVDTTWRCGPNGQPTEPDEVWANRLANQGTTKIEGFEMTLDLRFYGSHGNIWGGYGKTLRGTDLDPLREGHAIAVARALHEALKSTGLTEL